MSVGPDWKTVDMPFTALHDMKEGEAAICFSFGALPQKVEIASAQVLNFENKTSLAQLPVTRFTYAGREEGAAWRTQALGRIEDLRTATLNIRLVDAKGKPVKGAIVRASLLQPDFIWGTAVNEALLAKGLPDAGNYRNVLKAFFNSAVIENGFKAGAWNQTARREETLKAFDWLQQQGLRIRGHNLVWPAWKFNAALYKTTAQKDTAAFRKLIDADIKERMAITKGKVIAWDVINEMMHEKEFFAYLPKNETAQWFKLAKRLDPKAQLFLNEYGMLNSIASPGNIQEYISIAYNLRNAGAPVEALGIQGHIGRQPRSPAQVLKDLDLFRSTGLPVQITEFDINMTDEELQADYTRDFLIAIYSHPVVTGFTMWGFWQGAHWKPDAAMFRKDWSPKPNAAVWKEWVLGKWKTKVQAMTDERGEVKARGHLGKYEITVTNGKSMVKKVYQLAKTATPLTITFN